MKCGIILLLCSYVLLVGCSGRSAHPENEALRRVEQLSDRHAVEAEACIDSIDRSSLSAHDRHFYDFLKLKIADKQHIRHTSDSLIRALINYASSNKNYHYAETLYYGGRVYSDLGDYPTALQYFQAALEALPETNNNLLLRSNILSQTANRLNYLCMYREAIPYMEECININRQLNDSTNEVFNLQDIGFIYLSAEQYDKAERYLKESLKKSVGLPELFAARSRVNLATVKYEKGEMDSALFYIRNTPELVSPVSRNSALMDAARIYLANGMPDSAYIFAKEIIKSDNPNQKDMAYHWLLLPELQPYSHPDTLIRYVFEYSQLLEDFYDDNENQQALLQQSLYNYRVHDRERAEAEQAAHRLRLWVAGFIIMVLALAVVILLLRNRAAHRMLELRRAIGTIKELKCGPKAAAMSEEELRAQLREEIAAFGKGNHTEEVPSAIADTEAYRALKHHIEINKPIPEGSSLWQELDAAVHAASPHFRQNLNLLAGKRLSKIYYHTALLMKCGCNNSQIAAITGRARSAISWRRSALADIFDADPAAIVMHL